MVDLSALPDQVTAGDTNLPADLTLTYQAVKDHETRLIETQAAIDQFAAAGGYTARGNYDPATTYAVRDIVVADDGWAYTPTVEVTGVAPPADPWVKFAEGGITQATLDKRVPTHDIREWGDGNWTGGAVDANEAIAGMFAQGAKSLTVPAPDNAADWYGIGTSVVVPNGKELLLARGATLKPIADVDIVKVAQKGFFTGTIDVSAFSGFTKAAFALVASANFGSSGVNAVQAHNVELIGKTGANGEGVGVLLDSGLDPLFRISFAKLMAFFIRGFGTSVRMYGRLRSDASGGYVNGNQLIGFHLSQPKRFVDMLRETTACGVSQNKLIGFSAQSAAGMTGGVTCEGVGNFFDLSVFDWASAVGDATPSWLFPDMSADNEVQTNEPSRRIASYNGSNGVSTTDRSKPPARIVSPPGSVWARTAHGDADDWLPGCRFDGSTLTATPAPSAGPLANILEVDRSRTATWNTAGPHEVEVAFPAGRLHKFTSIGLHFNNNRKSQRVKVEVYRAGAWMTVGEILDNVANSPQFHVPGAIATSVERLRFTFEGFSRTNAVNEIVVERLWAFETEQPSRVFAPGSICRPVNFRPGGITPYTTVGTAYADMDATNLVVDVVIPPSGRALVKLGAMAQVAVPGQQLRWALREGSTTVAGTAQIVTQADQPVLVELEVEVTGTPGALRTFKWAHAHGTAGDVGTTRGGGVYGSFRMDARPA